MSPSRPTVLSTVARLRDFSDDKSSSSDPSRPGHANGVMSEAGRRTICCSQPCSGKEIMWFSILGDVNRVIGLFCLLITFYKV